MLRERLRIGLVALGVFALVAAFYARTVGYSFVNFDDNDYVFYNPHTMRGLTPDNVKWTLTDTASTWNWHPLTLISLMADVSMSGVRTAPVPLGDMRFETPEFNRLSGFMHGHNVALHAANAALLFVLIVLLTRRRCVPAAALLALVWAVHPLRAEAVCWVSERKEVLCAFFMLLSLLAYVRDRAVLALVAFALALLSKPVAVMLPFVFAAYDLLFVGRLRWVRLAAAAALSLGLCVATVVAQQHGMPGIGEIGLGQRLVNACSAIGVYARQTVLPYGLSAMYTMENGTDWLAFAGGVAIVMAAVFAGVRYCLGRRDLATVVGVFASAWVLLGLLPMLGIVQVGDQAHADRYTYWASCGLAASLGLCLAGLPAPASRFGKGAVVALAAAALVFGGLGWRQSGSWRNTRTVYEQAYEATQGGWAAAALAQAWRHLDPEKSERIYREGIEKHPKDAFLLSQYAVQLAVRRTTRDFGECVSLARRALAEKPHCAYAYEALGFVAIRTGAFEAAEANFIRAIQLGSDSPVVRKALEDAQRKMAERRTQGPWQ